MMRFNGHIREEFLIAADPRIRHLGSVEFSQSRLAPHPWLYVLADGKGGKAEFHATAMRNSSLI